jgi:hypothetical protein
MIFDAIEQRSNPMTDRNTELLREAFEADCRAHGLDYLEWHSGGNIYTNRDTQLRYEGWRAASTRLSDALGVIEGLREALKPEYECHVCDGSGEVFDEDSNLMGVHGWLTCWTCYDNPIRKALTTAERFMKGE